MKKYLSNLYSLKNILILTFAQFILIIARMALTDICRKILRFAAEMSLELTPPLFFYSAQDLVFFSIPIIWCICILSSKAFKITSFMPMVLLFIGYLYLTIEIIYIIYLLIWGVNV